MVVHRNWNKKKSVYFKKKQKIIFAEVDFWLSFYRIQTDMS